MLCVNTISGRHACCEFVFMYIVFMLDVGIIAVTLIHNSNVMDLARMTL